MLTNGYRGLRTAQAVSFGHALRRAGPPAFAAHSPAGFAARSPSGLRSSSLALPTHQCASGVGSAGGNLYGQLRRWLSSARSTLARPGSSLQGVRGVRFFIWRPGGHASPGRRWFSREPAGAGRMPWRDCGKKNALWTFGPCLQNNGHWQPARPSEWHEIVICRYCSTWGEVCG